MFDIDGKQHDSYKLADVFIKIKFRGASFMYHQIRRMIGMIVQLTVDPCRHTSTYSPASVEESFGDKKKMIWTAPAAGLFLSKLEMDKYNSKLDSLGMQNLELNIKELQSIHEFKSTEIYPAIINAEHKDRLFGIWLKGIVDPEFLQTRNESFAEVYANQI